MKCQFRCFILLSSSTWEIQFKKCDQLKSWEHSEAFFASIYHKGFTFPVQHQPLFFVTLSSFSPNDVSTYIIYAGRHQINGFNRHQTSHYVKRVVIPSGYVDPHSGLDVALVELSSAVTRSDYIRPVCLPSSNTLFPGGMQCYVTGWGNIRDDGKASSQLFYYLLNL